MLGNLALRRNGTTANSWDLWLAGSNLGTFSLTTDGAFAAIVIRRSGATLTVYGSSQIPVGASLPLTPLLSVGNSTSVTGTMYLGANSDKTNHFRGVLSNLLIYARGISDAELIRNMNVLRSDMKSRGVTLP